MKCGQFHEKTRVKEDQNNNPIWNEKFSLHLDGTEDFMIIEIWNKNVIKDKFIAGYKVPVKNLQQMIGNQTCRLGRDAEWRVSLVINFVIFLLIFIIIIFSFSLSFLI